VSVRDARTKGRGRGTEGAGGCCTDRRKGDSLSRVLWVERRLLGLGRGSMELLEMRGERPERSRAPDGGGGGRRAARQQPMHIAGPDASTDALRRSGPSCSCSACRSFSTLFTRSYEVETAWGQGLAVRRRERAGLASSCCISSSSLHGHHGRPEATAHEAPSCHDQILLRRLSFVLKNTQPSDRRGRQRARYMGRPASPGTIRHVQGADPVA
jgi:hypothetical protein